MRVVDTAGVTIGFRSIDGGVGGDIAAEEEALVVANADAEDDAVAGGATGELEGPEW
jgi:hypothetical protein